MWRRWMRTRESIFFIYYKRLRAFAKLATSYMKLLAYTLINLREFCGALKLATSSI
jgi:hypothetical protein